MQKYQLQLAQQELERTQIRIDAGVQTKAEIYEIEANLAAQEQALVHLNGSSFFRMFSLCALLLAVEGLPGISLCLLL